VAGANVRPRHRGTPGCPLRGREAAAAVQADIPLAGVEVATGDVGLAITVEVGDADVNPGNRRAPGVPERGREAAAAGQAHVQLAGADVPPRAVCPAVAVQV